MRNYKTGMLAAMLAAGTLLLCGCGPVDNSMLDAEPDMSVSLNVPYVTATPLPDYLDVPDQVVIDSNGAVTLNDKSMLGIDTNSSKEDETSYHSLSLGDTGIAVQALQTRLKELGYFTSGISGVFDAETESAVKHFEQTYGIMQTGIATPAFQAKLFASTAPVYGSSEYDKAVVSQYTTLQSGSVGSSVWALQRRLKELGYPIKELTAVFDAETEQAVRLFYAAYGLEPRAVAYVALQKELYSDDARPYSVNGQVQSGEPDEDTLMLGNVGTLVMQLQNRLIQLGYLDGNASGIFDAETESAVKAFEAACNLEQTGKLTPSLQAILLSDHAPAYGSSYVAEAANYTALSLGDESSAVTSLQKRLIALGYAGGSASGVYGDETASAMRVFQRCNGLDETGDASPQDQAALFSPAALTYQDAKSGAKPKQTVAPQATMSVPEDFLLSTDLPTLTSGSYGDDVLALQQRLNELGYECLEDSTYSTSTEAAVRAFQAAVGVSQTGQASSSLRKYLASSAAPRSSVKLYNATQDFIELRLGSSGDAVTSLQRRLWKLGYLLTDQIEGSVGTFNDATREAVVSTQLAMGYDDADGIAGAEFQCFLFSEYGEYIKK